VPKIAPEPVLREVAERTSPELSPVKARFRREALDLIAREGLIAPAYSFALVALDKPAAPVLHAGGETLHAPRLLPESGELTALACGVATIGARLEQRVSELFAARSVSLALAVDEVGNELLFAVGRRLQDRMLIAGQKRGLSMAGELRPGDPGLALDAQAAVLRLAGAAAIDVRLTRGHLLQPIKSTSMVIGVGIDLPPARWSRCDDCRSRATCKIVRAAELVDA
jgi:hypothetical protein